MKKRLLSALLCLSMTVCMVPTLALAADTASGTCGDNITWTLSRDGTLTISGTGEMDDYDYYEGSTPWEYYKPQIQKIILEDGITSVGECTFIGCKNVTEVSLPESVTQIESNAFCRCNSLKHINIPKNVVSIGAVAFGDCTDLTDIKLPNSITSIGDRAFADCDSLTSIVIPDSITVLSEGMFSDCDSLKDVTIPNSVTQMENAVFEFCDGLESITIPNSITDITYRSFDRCTNLKSIVIPDSVTGIEDYAFYGCSSLQDMKIPANVYYIGECAFAGCSSLESVTIPDKITSIRKFTFDGCSGLKEVNLSNVSEIDESAFCNCESLTSLKVSKDVVDIGSCAFGINYDEDTRTTTVKENFVAIIEKDSRAEDYCQNWGMRYVIGENFADVDETAYYAQPVQWAVRQGVTNGTADTIFSPDAVCTRGQIVTLLWRAIGCPEPLFNTSEFTDVSEDAYYYKAMLWAVDYGITNGTSDTTFSPNEGCTRAQAMTFLWRTAGKKESSAVNPFRDVNTSAYYMDAVLWAIENDITKGTSDVEFSPDALCTRSQIVTFLYRDMA